jgi:hypothetical protein
MKFLDYFRYFLQDTVNLNQTRIDQLDSRVTAVSNYLDGHETMGLIVQETIRQGSYAHKTIIKPVGNHEFDADVLLLMAEQQDWEPYEYTRRLRAAFRDSATYKDMVGRRTRSVELDYAGEFHMDLVPYLVIDERYWITNHKTNQLEETNPEGFNEWLDERDRITGRRLVEVIRIMKYLRDYKQTFHIKSFILSMLLAEQVSQVQLLLDPGCYSDLPTTLVNILESLDGWLQMRPTMPLLSDPSCSASSFNHRWSKEEYANFRNKIHAYAAKVREAYDEQDRDTSLKAWQALLGPGFQKPPAIKSVKLAEQDLAPSTEQFIDRSPFSIPMALDPRYSLKIKGRVQSIKGTGWDRYDLSRRGDRVAKRRDIVFTITRCDVPPPFEVYWKVRNYGQEAADLDALRGEIRKDAGNRRHIEPTAYRGNHYVECYVVKSGCCVATNRQRVVII